MEPLSRAVILGLLSAVFAGPATASAEDRYIPFEGEKSAWRDGFDRHEFVMDEASREITPFKRPEGEGFAVGAPEKGKRRCVVIVPKVPAPGNPWSWRGQYWDHEPQAEVELLRRGFHVAFITPDPGEAWESWYAYLTEKHGLSRKPAFVGMSKGGVNAYDWAAAHPDKVSCIYADNPAIRPPAFAKLGDLAENGVSLLNVCGSQDFLLERHTLAIEARYHQLGGRITVMIKDGPAHHPHSLRDPKPIADWIVEHARPPRDRPDFAAEGFARSSYYSLAETYVPLKAEQTYATCRGPGFAECYDRYDARTGSPWGVKGMAVIVPKAAAPGRPWVFLADPIGRDAAVDQALLAKGIHIVVAPLVAQAGPVRGQWDEVYRKLVDRGFSKKPVLEGAGAAAGEAYAWAVANPDKVSCLYAENPAIRSLMAKEPPIDHLDVLAKAGVPILHACGALDPWLEGQTRVVESRYKSHGGSMSVIVDEGRGHLPTAPRDPKPVVDFLVARQESSPRASSEKARDYRFDRTISRDVLENYLSRAISMEGMLNGRGDLDDNIRMLRDTGAKFIGRALCLWGGEADLLRNLERAREQVPKVRAADPEMIIQACIFEIVTEQVNQVPVPEWAFVALGRPVETRNFRYTDMLYPDGRRVDHWRRGQSVPDVSRPETKLWFYFLAASYIDLGIEAIHFGQTELMNGNDLNRNVEYNGAVDITPFRGAGWEGSCLEGLGGGVGFSAGDQKYALNQSSIAFLNNGEATTNPSFVSVVGLPFYIYNQNIKADGMRTRIAPHVYWYGRFSVLAEMMNFSRELTDGRTSGRSTQLGYYVNASYWLTGERDFAGNGFQGYSTIEPLHPFLPSRGQFGPGAWQIATQWSQFNAGRGDIERGFVDVNRSTDRMDSFMAGLNWWPNKYTRLSFDYVWTGFNNPIPLAGPGRVDEYNTFWMRFAMFF